MFPSIPLVGQQVPEPAGTSRWRSAPALPEPAGAGRNQPVAVRAGPAGHAGAGRNQPEPTGGGPPPVAETQIPGAGRHHDSPTRRAVRQLIRHWPCLRVTWRPRPPEADRASRCRCRGGGPRPAASASAPRRSVGFWRTRTPGHAKARPMAYELADRPSSGRVVVPSCTWDLCFGNRRRTATGWFRLVPAGSGMPGRASADRHRLVPAGSGRLRQRRRGPPPAGSGRLGHLLANQRNGGKHYAG